VALEARVSKGPEQRRKLAAQLTELLIKNGAAPDRVHVAVLCAYKQGYSWLLDSIAPQLKGKPVDQVQIEFAPYKDKQRPEVVTATLQVAPPADARPQIASIPPTPLDATGHFVQWEHPIGPGKATPARTHRDLPGR